MSEAGNAGDFDMAIEKVTAVKNVNINDFFYVVILNNVTGNSHLTSACILSTLQRIYTLSCVGPVGAMDADGSNCNISNLNIVYNLLCKAGKIDGLTTFEKECANGALQMLNHFLFDLLDVPVPNAPKLQQSNKFLFV